MAFGSFSATEALSLPLTIFMIFQMKLDSIKMFDVHLHPDPIRLMCLSRVKRIKQLAQERRIFRIHPVKGMNKMEGIAKQPFHYRIR